jgi:hypothetical protein
MGTTPTTLTGRNGELDYIARLIEKALTTADRLSSITTPTLVLASEGSGENLRAWAKGVSAALPNGSLRLLKGEWHGVPPDVLAPVLNEYLIGR